ncbi:MAG: S-layer homology domain-containing protein [Cellulosilyticaceae bacterium]
MKSIKNMKQTVAVIVLSILSVTQVLAYEGEMGYFGGISPGYKLPTLTEQANTSKKKLSKITLPYKEMIYISGKPVEVEGTIEMRPQVIDYTKKPVGNYTESYMIKTTNENKEKLDRNITLDTKYMYDATTKQVTKTSSIKKWTEIVVVGGQTYQLDSSKSSFSKSMLEDFTPGVTYYRGDIQYEAVYKNASSSGGNMTSVSVNGPIYGYDHAYAKTETQRRNIHVTTGEGSGYYIEETPTFTTYKEIQYGANEPNAISFGGNYKEIIRGDGALTYDIIAGSTNSADENRGAISITDVPSLEQLNAINIPSMKGHPAESDVKKMYSLKVFSGEPTTFSPNQVVTRGAYIEMLVRALKLTIPDEKEIEQSAKVFTDVKTTDKKYPYYMAAYNAGLISGGEVNVGQHLTREAMVVMNIRALGLERLGIATLGATTPFIDDNLISSWAKSSVYAASRIGLIDSTNGYLFPNKKVTYIDVAALLNQMMNYMRYDLRKDYDEKMLM